MTRVVLATGNPGKVAEMQQSLLEFGFDIYPQSDFEIPEAVEDGLTFVENAIKKARHACKLTEMPAIADDSGLEVDALLGAPGIYSARYAETFAGSAESAAITEDSKSVVRQSADAANNKLLLEQLQGVENRTARFHCVIVYMVHPEDPTPIICQGTWQGEIAETAAGENGFGYDPLFYIPELKCHSAELDPGIKKQISHRAKALAELKHYLKKNYEFKAE